MLTFGVGLRRSILSLIALLAWRAAGHADIAVLTNGTTFKIASYRFEDQSLVLLLKGGGDVTIPVSLIQGFVPDEVIEEVEKAQPSTANPNDARALAIETARRHGLDPELVLAVIAVESAFRKDAVSPKGAQGLMQLMPGTARELGVKDAFDPAQNLDAGARYLNALLEQFHGDVKLAIAAYNAGPGAVKRHKGIPPYRETRAHVEKVLERYRAQQQ
jgi:soluble lytic murein transglycosylase-like protein